MSPHKQEEVLAADKAKKEEVRGYDTVKQILHVVTFPRW